MPETSVSTDPSSGFESGFLAQLLRYSPNIVFVRDRQGRYLRVSESYCQLFALAAEDFLGRTAQQALGEHLGARVLETDAQVFVSGAPIELDIDIDTRQGRRAYRTLKFPLIDALGVVQAVCGIGTDITSGKRHQDALSSAALAVSGAQGDSLFSELARFLAQALDVDGAFIAVCANAELTEARTEALFVDGQFQPSLHYSLAETVCGTVVGRTFRIIPSAVREIYPADRMFEKYGIEAYAAHPLVDSQGRALGLMGVLSRRPLLDQPLVQSMLKIFAARAESEMERLQAERDLRASEASYRAIFEFSEDAILVHDWDSGTIVDANPKACQMFGLRLEELKRVPLDQFNGGVVPFDPQEAPRRFAEIKTGRTQHYEWRRKLPTGDWRWEESHAKGATIAGQPRVLAVVRDITARKLAEQTLRDAALAVSGAHGENVYTQLVTELARILHVYMAFIAEAKPDDPSTMHMCAFFVDGQIGQSFDYPIAGTPCETVVGKGYRAYTHDLHRHFPQDENFVRMSLESYAGFPLSDSTGKSIGIIAVAGRRPISNPDLVEATLKIFATRAMAEISRQRADAELREREGALRQAQKMEAIGQLTGGIAHDFNNILTSIMGYLTLAAEHQEEQIDDAKLAHYLDEAHASAQRARDLIQQMLTFSRGQRGAPRALQLSTGVTDSLKMMRSTLPATVEISSRLQPDASAVMMDPVQLSQVLINLCINARDAMNGAGRIAIAVTENQREQGVCASCRKALTGHFVVLSVRDTGPGISAEVQERMFEPFFTTKEVGRGTGMGLATVHGIVHEHGGHIQVESEPGKGTRFRVLLPALPPQASAPSGDVAGSRLRTRGQPGLRGRVLVVDDERAVGAFMRDLLEKWGLDVSVEPNPQRAEEIISTRREHFDLLITDQAMPRMSGLELAGRVRSAAPQLPILLYTGYAEGIEDADLQAAGIRALLRKPLDAEQLYAQIQTLLTPPSAQEAAGTNM